MSDVGFEEGDKHLIRTQPVLGAQSAESGQRTPEVYPPHKL